MEKKEEKKERKKETKMRRMGKIDLANNGSDETFTYICWNKKNWPKEGKKKRKIDKKTWGKQAQKACFKFQNY